MGNPTRAEVEAELAAFEASQAPSAVKDVQQQAPETDRKPVELDPVDNAEPVEPIAIEQAKEPAPEEDEREKDPDYWKHRFKTLEGMARKEKEEQSLVQQEQSRQHNELMQHLRENQLKQTQESIEPVPVLPTRAQDVTDEMLLDAFSEEAIEESGATFLRCQIANENQFHVTQSRDEAKTRSAQEQQANDWKRSEDDLFWKRVEAVVPDAELMDRTDSRWHDWLTKDYRSEMLTAAMAKGDADAVAKAMLQCKADSESQKPAVNTALPTVEEQAIPGTTVHVPAATSPRVVTYTHSQVDKYYNDRQKGKLDDKYTHAEILQLETQIKRAASEGRIVPG